MATCYFLIRSKTEDEMNMHADLQETPPAELNPLAPPLSGEQLEAMWQMAISPAPENDSGFTPRIAIDIIMATRAALGQAVMEIGRMIEQPQGLDNVVAALADRFAERREEQFIARQFAEDGGMWTIFAHTDKAVAYAPTRNAAITLAHMLSGHPIPPEVLAEMQEGGDEVQQPNPRSGDPEQSEGGSQRENEDGPPLTEEGAVAPTEVNPDDLDNDTAGDDNGDDDDDVGGTDSDGSGEGGDDAVPATEADPAPADVREPAADAGPTQGV